MIFVFDHNEGSSPAHSNSRYFDIQAHEVFRGYFQSVVLRPTGKETRDDGAREKFCDANAEVCDECKNGHKCQKSSTGARRRKKSSIKSIDASLRPERLANPL